MYGIIQLISEWLLPLKQVKLGTNEHIWTVKDFLISDMIDIFHNFMLKNIELHTDKTSKNWFLTHPPMPFSVFLFFVLFVAPKIKIFRLK